MHVLYRMSSYISLAIALLSSSYSVDAVYSSTVYPSATISYSLNASLATINATSTVLVHPTPVYVDGCFGKTSWKDDSVDISCATTACAKITFALLSKYMSCNTATQSTDMSQIAGKVVEYAAAVAVYITNISPSSVFGNGSLVFRTDKFVVEAGYMNKEKSDLREFNLVPDFKKPNAAAFTGNKDQFKISKITLESGVTTWFAVLFKDILQTSSKMGFHEAQPSTIKEMEDIGVYKHPARSGKWFANSQIVHIGFNPFPKTLTDYIEVTLLHKQLSYRKNHICIRVVGSLGGPNSYWSTSGCHHYHSDRFKTICRCTSPGSFAIVSQLDEKAPPSKGFSRSFFSQIAAAISGFIILGLLCSIAYPTFYGYTHLPRVQIYVLQDMTYCMVYASFLVGVMISEDLYYAETAAGCIHYFQTAVLTWLAAEGIHNYHTITPVYDTEVTSPAFFYSSIGFGISAAFAGACAGYPYDLKQVVEFSWMKVSSSGIGYFLIGPLISTLGVLLLYALLFYELSCWIGSKLDYIYRRATEYVKRSLSLLLLGLLSWSAGIMARNRPDSLGYHYLFLCMYSVQGAVVIYLHFLKNTEIAEFRALRKTNHDGSASVITEQDLISLQSSMRFSEFDIRKSTVNLKTQNAAIDGDGNVENEEPVQGDRDVIEEERVNSAQSKKSFDEPLPQDSQDSDNSSGTSENEEETQQINSQNSTTSLRPDMRKSKSSLKSENAKDLNNENDGENYEDREDEEEMEQDNDVRLGEAFEQRLQRYDQDENKESMIDEDERIVNSIEQIDKDCDNSDAEEQSSEQHANVEDQIDKNMAEAANNASDEINDADD